MLGGWWRPSQAMSWDNSALLCCPQEPPEDDANIIEKILASRIVQKEVSGKGVGGVEVPGQRRDGPWLLYAAGA